MDVKELDILGEDISQHWYYSSKAKAMTHLLSGISCEKVLDIGAGSGFFSKFLLAKKKAEEAWCVDTSYDTDSDEIEHEKVIHYRHTIDMCDADLVLLMDVIEHVNDDVALLREYAHKVTHGSRFFITVPAFNFLWCDHDDFLEHKRRYSLNQLESVVRKADLNIIRGGYIFSVILPIVIPLRFMRKIVSEKKLASSQLTRHHPATNRFLKFLCNLELPFRKYNRIAGLTVYCLAEKA
jgi:SAM-dependent methyltransferase